MKTQHDYVKDIIAVLNAYERKDALFSCQGQSMDGYSALANFLDIARKLRNEISEVIEDDKIVTGNKGVK
ncbi:MAG: hypothetical protein IPI57_20765 [Candidatus Competibacteraceae bacterium]|nr:hypothetical protein [Candidatus Competibacteraceae bacterium]